MSQGQRSGQVRREPGSGEAAEQEPAMSRDEWVAQFCRQVGVDPPSREEMGALLKLAATAAHASERPAAPLACWAAGRSARSASELQKVAESVSPSS
jgi:Domain of unknown function (DUF6457)